MTIRSVSLVDGKDYGWCIDAWWIQLENTRHVMCFPDIINAHHDPTKTVVSTRLEKNTDHASTILHERNRISTTGSGSNLFLVDL